MEEYCQNINIENREIWEKGSHTVLAYMKKIDNLKEG